MKNTGECSKCQSTDIVRISGYAGPSAIGNYVPLSEISTLRAVGVTRFLCLACGFSEEWVEKRIDLEDIRKRYQK